MTSAHDGWLFQEKERRSQSPWYFITQDLAVASSTSALNQTFYSLIGKRCLDATCASLGLILLSPALCLVSLIIRFTSPGPVFFRQTRVGQFGKPFRIFKFRTMVANGNADGPSLTASGDPRITPFGRLLRSTKVDELAQLLNVIKGEMSLVGPRPEVPQYVAVYTKSQRRVLLVKPGITGPAASMYEEELLAEQADKESFYLTAVLPAKLETDVSYSKSVRISTDLKLIFQTIARVTARTAEICRQRFPASQKQNVEMQE